MGSQYLTHVYDRWNLTVREWQNPDHEPRVAQVLENLSKMLNSNEQLRMDRSFNLSLVVVRALPHGGGKSRQRRAIRITPGEANASRLPEKKKSILQLPRDDRNMCCAEALWTAYQRAFNANYGLCMRGRVSFQREVQSFQQDVGIPFGTVCGPAELERFAAWFEPFGFSIVVIDTSRGYQVLRLMYHDHHYDTIRSFKGFFTKNYYCFQCLKPYDNEGYHQCSANQDHCPTCLQNGCEDYVRYRQTGTLRPAPCLMASNVLFALMPSMDPLVSNNTVSKPIMEPPSTRPISPSVERFNDAVSVANGPSTMAFTRTNHSINVITTSVRPAWITSILRSIDVTSNWRKNCV